jgi:hypothetical protein
MKNNLWGKVTLDAVVVCFIHAGLLVANATAQTNDTVQGHAGLAHLQDLEKRFGPRFSARLSSGGANAFQSAKMLSKLQARGIAQQSREGGGEMMSNARANLLSMPNVGQSTSSQRAGPVIVNDPNFDYDTTRFTGFTQSETSSAWCGNNIVVGFNDSAAFAHTAIAHQAAAISLSGVAVSHDGGHRFVGLPFLNPGPALNPGSPFFDSELVGDPVVVCSDPQHFAYASIQEQVPVDAMGNVIAAFAEMAVSRSSDGGVTWDDPMTVAKKDLNSHFLDKEWLAVDPRNPNNLYVTYTDFQAHGTESDCAGGTVGIEAGPDVSLEMVASKNGGLTWSDPVRFGRRCNLGLGENFSGSQVLVSRHGGVYVAYASILDAGADAQIIVRRSDDGGATFHPEVVAGTAIPAANPLSPQLQGFFRTNPFPSLAVDNSAGPHSGSLYLAWTDASRTQIPDLLIDFFGGVGGYAFGDIVFSRSFDGGNSWSPAKLVSPTPKNFQGAGRDQFMPGVAVDLLGNVAVCYSDRRNDHDNFFVDHFCSVSQDQGTTFADIRETPASWTPNTFTDGIINPLYMGDYDTVTADATRANSGFFNTFQIQTNGNPDVFGFELR